MYEYFKLQSIKVCRRDLGIYFVITTGYLIFRIVKSINLIFLSAIKKSSY